MLLRNSLWMGVLLSFGGCMAPPTLTQQDMIEAAEARREVMQLRLNTIEQQLTLPQALAWSLDNNLEFRLRAYDAALATGNRQLATMSMLPSLAARAGYRNRSKVSASVSESVATGTVSLVPSTSSDREAHSYGLEMSWNVLDFGLAWFRAREFGEQSLIAEEERRRVLHQLSVELIFAWDKAVAFQQLKPQLQEARRRLGIALNRSEKIMQQRLLDQIDVIEYHAALLLILKRINELAQEMDQSQDELARLLALPAGAGLELSLDDHLVLDLHTMGGVSLAEAQWQALLNRPEMKQALYSSRSAKRDSIRRIIEAFPSLVLSYGSNYDSNSFLVNNRWENTSANVSLNLINLATLPTRHRLGKVGEAAAKARVDLQATAILSQVAIAEKALKSAQLEFCLSERLEALDQKKMSMMEARATAAALDNLTLTRAQVNNILIMLEAALDRAELRRARLLLASSMGLSAVPEYFEAEDLPGKAAEIKQWLSSGLNDELALLMEQGAAYKTDSGETDAGETDSGERSIMIEPAKQKDAKQENQCAKLY